MSDELALLRAICAHPDEDTPRLALADWLDENKPDAVPSPSSGPSARAEYIRTQCRLAAGGFDAPDYPELLERQEELAPWLNAHDPDSNDFERLYASSQFDAGDAGEWGEYRRGFLEVLDFEEFGESPAETVEFVAGALEDSLAKTPGRTLRLYSAMTDEIALLAKHPIFQHLRGLFLDYLDDGDEDEAITAIAESPGAVNLRRLHIDFPIDVTGCRALARSPHLSNLEYFGLDYPMSAVALKALHGAKWFRNLRRLHLWLGPGDALRWLADVPRMPRLVSLSLRGLPEANLASLRRFVASESFPRLAHLDLEHQTLSAESVAVLARGAWPLRHLIMRYGSVRKVGAEALAEAPFARTLRVLQLRECGITTGGVQALAASEALSQVRHLDLAGNPIGPGGLQALAASPHLPHLRVLQLGRTNTSRSPIAASDVVQFLSAFETPHLRHLVLDHLPVALRGSRVLADSPAFANLTRLELENTGIGSRGTQELLASKTLGNLVMLDLDANKVGSAVEPLANPKVLPRLGRCRLGRGIPVALRKRIRRRAGIEG